MADVIETHDRTRFDVRAFSFGPDTRDAMRLRMEAAFESFIDVRDRSDREIAALARELELDIAVDLGGFSDGGRPGLFALRAAPLQVGYLGYLGTMGADFMDYLFADASIIGQKDWKHYAEKIIYLPCYQANDSKRPVPQRRPSREELGLPATAFVFCCFNATYKISPVTFDSWMRILKRARGSVLFLLAESETARDNLREAARTRGVEPDRLVFAGKVPVAEYLARYAVADLFLDTLPYNAGTTASDALWTGLPVLTRIGQSFAARVAASLLNAVGLPELITTTADQYESVAVELARCPDRLARIREKLRAHQLTTPLFDAALCTRNIELAYTNIYERHLMGRKPDHVFTRSSFSPDGPVSAGQPLLRPCPENFVRTSRTE
jgi:predicted O-linked N-acetylglucosamine transferase (SPINDLY family)